MTTDERRAQIEQIIRANCYVYIRSVEGRTLPTDDIAAIEVHGIEQAVSALAALPSQAQAVAEAVAAEREACAKAADDWLAAFKDRNPVHVSAREWACGAVMDIAENIRLRPAAPPVIAEEQTK
jgi:hypothetical protein